MRISGIYKQLCGFNPYPEQEEIFKSLWSIHIPLLIRLPCGYGKTESVIVPFLTQALQNRWDISPRLIYVLPTKALCNEIYNRICEYAVKVKSISGKRITIGIEHGISSLDPLFFSDICITTFDQFLYGYARSKPQVGGHIDMPAGAFANSCIVFDEAHLYSPYTHALMKALLDILYCAKIPVIVMTATMPKSLQDSLFERVEHQLIEFKGNNFIKRNISWDLVDWSLLKNGEPSKELKELLRSYKDKKILIVANRVNVAQQLAIGLKEDNPVLIHSRFSVTDRAVQEKAVLEILGKDAIKKEGIVISTQVCEVGLDISCDLLITECASSDALIQRIGRVVRWGGEGKIFIVQPEESVPYKDKKLGEEKGDFVAIARKYLEENKELNFTSWKDLEKFSNQMPYYVGYVEARNALGQLFEQTLYADNTPHSLSARDELYCTIFCVNVEKKRGETKIKILGGREDATFIFKKDKKVDIPYFVIKDACMNVPYYWFRRFWRKENGKKKGLQIASYDVKEQRLVNEFSRDNFPRPFQIYALQVEDETYQPNIGFRPKEIVEDEEACLIC